jgi:hypothetical protein
MVWAILIFINLFAKSIGFSFFLGLLVRLVYFVVDLAFWLNERLS